MKSTRSSACGGVVMRAPRRTGGYAATPKAVPPWRNHAT